LVVTQLRSMPARLTRYAAVVLVTVVCGAYWNTLHVPFLLDDRSAILDNPSIRDLGNWRALFGPNFTTAGGRPLFNLTLALNYAWGGFDVTSYHVANLAIHAAAALLLFAVVRRTFISPLLNGRFGKDALWLATLVAAIWALHPLHTGAVTYISQRSEILASLFCLLALYCFLKSKTSPRPGLWLGWSVAASACGAATKEIAVTIPVIVLLYELTLFRASFRWRSAWRFYAALACSWLLLGYLIHGSHLAKRSVGFATDVGAMQYALTESRVLLDYLKLAVWPSPLVFDYGSELLNQPVDRLLPFFLLALAGTVAVIVAHVQRHVAALPALLFLVLLSPTSSFVPVALQPMAESRMYLPLAPIVALVVTSLYTWSGRRVFPLVIIAVLALGIGTIGRNRDYQSEIGLWQDTVAKNPGSFRAHFVLGLLYGAQPGGRTKAIEHYEQALRLRPDDAEAHNNLGQELAAMPARRAEALPHYEIALRLNPNYAEAHNNLAVYLADFPDRTPDAIRHYQRALAIKPTLLEAHFNLANILVDIPAQIPQAISHYERAWQLRPDLPLVATNLAIAYYKAGRVGDAIKRLEITVNSHPDFEPARARLQTIRAAHPDPYPDVGR
jgi:protein O-mannosyl-transferase